MENRQDNSIRSIYEELELAPASDWDAPSEEVWNAIAAKLPAAASQKPNKSRKYAFPLLLLLLLIEHCPSGYTPTNAPPPPPLIPTVEKRKMPATTPPQALAQVSAISAKASVADIKVSREESDLKILEINYINELNFAPSLAHGIERELRPVFSTSNPSPIVSLPKVSCNARAGVYFARRVPQKSKVPSITPTHFWSLGIEGGFGPFTAGLEWSEQRWHSVHSIALTYREDGSHVDERGRVVREYSNALSGAFGEGELDITLANARQNDGADIADGEMLHLRVRAQTRTRSLSAPIGLEKIWKTGPVYLALRGGGVFHANVSNRFSIEQVQSLRARIQPIRTNWRIREVSAPKTWIDAYAGARAYLPLGKGHTIYLQTEYRRQLSPSNNVIRTDATSIQTGYVFIF